VTSETVESARIFLRRDFKLKLSSDWTETVGSSLGSGVEGQSCSGVRSCPLEAGAVDELSDKPNLP